MQIIENDFRVDHVDKNYVLYFLKVKKELKEDPKEPYKLIGYYTDPFNAIKKALNWRMDEKYPFKEPSMKFHNNYVECKQALKQLDTASKLLYEPIFKLKEQLFYEHKRFLDRCKG